MLQKYLDRLNSLYENWSNEIPDMVLHGGMKDKKYKCRINWFQGVYITLLNGFRLDHISDSSIKEAYKEFVEYAKDTGLGSRLTISQDIDGMDKVLLMAIDHVKQKLQIPLK